MHDTKFLSHTLLHPWVISGAPTTLHNKLHPPTSNFLRHASKQYLATDFFDGSVLKALNNALHIDGQQRATPSKYNHDEVIKSVAAYI